MVWGQNQYQYLGTRNGLCATLEVKREEQAGGETYTCSLVRNAQSLNETVSQRLGSYYYSKVKGGGDQLWQPDLTKNGPFGYHNKAAIVGILTGTM